MSFTWWLLQFLIPFGFMLFFVLGLMVPMMMWMDRKVSAYIQDRRGPNRAHIRGLKLFGIFHGVADLIKLAFKGSSQTEAKSRALFRWAPWWVFGSAILGMAVVPFGAPISFGQKTFFLQIAPLQAGILFVLAILFLGVHGIIWAGWSSGSAFSALGAMRASAQLFSYSIGLGLSVVGMLLVFGTTELVAIVQGQGANPLTWGIFLSPVGFLIFFTCLFAACHRGPFDMPHSTADLAGGYLSEYSSSKFALLYLSEYIHVVVGSAVLVTLFLGGWQVPFLSKSFILAHANLFMSMFMILSGMALLVLSAILLHSILKPFFHWRDHRDGEPGLFLPVTVSLGLVFLMMGVGVLPTLQVSWLPPFALLFLQTLSFCVKVLLVTFFFVWVRWTLPRFRYDQLMRIGWMIFIPLGIFNIFLTHLWATIWLAIWG